MSDDVLGDLGHRTPRNIPKLAASLLFCCSLIDVWSMNFGQCHRILLHHLADLLLNQSEVVLGQFEFSPAVDTSLIHLVKRAHNVLVKDWFHKFE